MDKPDALGNPASTPSDVLLALADRCEREEPSRELDRTIGMATGKKHPFDIYMPKFTTSLDAAVTLEPADAQIMVTRLGDGLWRVTYLGRPDINLLGGQKAPTEARARVAMALRARAAVLEASGITPSSTDRGEEK